MFLCISSTINIFKHDLIFDFKLLAVRGERCETVAPCHQDQNLEYQSYITPCLYGRCEYSGSDLQGHCKCDFNYEGDKCDHERNFCDPDPCNNNNCANKDGGYSCSCFSGYKGANCTVVI